MPALDGVRGLAILLVMFHHVIGELRPAAGVAGLPARFAASAWIGVDLFFVLSGFLITGILLDTRGRPGYFRNFVVRRALRIIPLYAVACLVVLVALPALGVLPQASVAAARDNAGWFAVFAANVLVAWHGWAAAGDLAHLWSIGVEEQFYLLWPLVVALVAPARFAPLALGVAVLAPVLRAAAGAMGLSPLAMYTLTPLHLDGLALGAFAAALRRRGGARPSSTRALTTAAVVATLVLAALFVRQGTLAWGFRSMHLVGYSALAIVGCRLVIGAADARQGGAAERVLGHGLLQVLGKYSYSLYLFHQLVLAGIVALCVRAGLIASLADAGLGAALLVLAATIAGSIAVAVVTWHLVEQPALALKRHFPD